LDINEESGEVKVHLFNINPIDENINPNERFNDGKCSPDGRFFAGTCDLIEKSEGGLSNNFYQVFKVIGWAYKALRYNNITPYLYRLDGFKKDDKE
jgi:sugar lactone lactonase YvrE